MTDRSTPGAGESWEGQVLDGRYRVGPLLGTGSFGRVYEGHHTTLAQRVAIKVFRSDIVLLAGGPDHVLADAKAASQIHHRNVVDVRDIGWLEGTVYVVTELVLGRTLHACLVQAGRLPWSRTRGVALQIVAALAAAHERNVLHRGLRAANCFVLEDPMLAAAGELRLKVSDFGFAHPGLAGGGRGEEHTSPFVGDASYTAPELARGDAASVRSDIYAFGVLLYRMLAGALPFEGGTPYQVLAAHVERPVPPLREKLRSIPAEVEAIVLRALAKDPSERFESVRDLELALVEIPARAAGEAAEAAPSAALDELVTGQHVQAQPSAAPARDEGMHAAFEGRVDEPGELPTSMFDRRMMTPYFGPTDAPAVSPEPTILLGHAMLADHALELPTSVASGLPQLMPGVRPAASAFPHLMPSAQSMGSRGGGVPDPTMFLGAAAHSPAPGDATMLLGDGVAASRPAGGPHETNDELVDGPTLHHRIGGAVTATEHLARPFAGAAAPVQVSAALPREPVVVYAWVHPALHGAPVATHAPGHAVPHAQAPVALHGAPNAPVPAVAHAMSHTPVPLPPASMSRQPTRQHPLVPASPTASAMSFLIVGVAMTIAGALVALAATCPLRQSVSERASSLHLPWARSIGSIRTHR